MTATPMLRYGAVKIKLSNEIRIMYLFWMNRLDRDGCLKLISSSVYLFP